MGLDSGGPGSEPWVAGNAAGFPMRARRLFYVWLSIEMAAGIIGLAEIVFVLPSVILIKLGGSGLDLIVPFTAISASVAIYLGWSAIPLVGQVAALGQRTS